jgi:cysteine synthase
MSESFSIERRKLMRFLGAKVPKDFRYRLTIQCLNQPS